jgi:hypothetical protein
MRRLAPLVIAVLFALLPVAGTRAQYVMDIPTLIGELMIGDLNGAIAGVNDANVVYVARVTDLFGIKQNGERLSRIIAMRRGVLRYFRSAIKGARQVRRVLEIHGQTIDQVIFATYTKDLTATLYVDNR